MTQPMKHFIQSLTLAMLSFCLFASCSNDSGEFIGPDGLWAPIQLACDSPSCLNDGRKDASSLKVPATGGEYVLTCTNYQHLDFCLADSDFSCLNGDGQVMVDRVWGDTVSNGWATRIIQGNHVKATVQPNDSTGERGSIVWLWNVDIRKLLWVNQRGK